MFKITLLIMSLVFSSASFATSDVHDRVYIVVQHIQEPEEFFIERAPIIGCLGPARGPQLNQFTAEYRVTSNIGCGEAPSSENINYLTCATVTSAKDNENYDSYSEITLDISKCEAKNNKKFITMVRTAAKLNFPQGKGKGEVKLNLVK